MNKKLSLSFLFLALFTLPACKRKKKIEETHKTKFVQTPEEYQMIVETPGEGEAFEESAVVRKSIFDEDEEAPLTTTYIEETESVILNPLAAEEAKKTEEAEVVARQEIGTIYFDFDDYSLRADQREIIHAVAHKAKTLLENSPALSIVIEGHACTSAGSPKYNLFISDRRAQVVENFLIRHGIPADRIQAFGMGTEKLIIPFGGKEEQAPNRRAVLYISRSAH